MAPEQHTPPLVLGLFAAGCFFLPLAYPGLQGLSSDLQSKRLILAALGFAISVVWLQGLRSGLTAWGHTALMLPALFYLLINLLSLSWSTHPFSGWVEAVQILVLLLLFLAFVALFPSSGLLLLAGGNTLGGLVVSLIGIAQYLGLGFGAIPSVGMPSSTFIFRNLAASYLVGSLPLGLFAFWIDPSPKRKLFWGLATSAMAIFLIYTRTRGAWAATAGALFLAGLLGLGIRPLRQALQDGLRSTLARPSGCLVWILCPILILGGAMLPENTTSKTIQKFDEQKSTLLTTATSAFTSGSDRGRLTMWQHTAEMIGDHPILGVGLDNWEFIYPLYDRGDKITEGSEPVRPHNDFLWITSELGIIGLGLYLWLLFGAVKTAFAGFYAADSNHRIAALAALTGLAALLAHGLVSFPKEQPATAFLFWLHLAILGRLSARAPAIRPIRFVPILGICLSTAALYLNFQHVAFDQHYYRALSAASKRHWTQAHREITAALDRGVFDHRALFLKARFLQQSGRVDEARQAYLNALNVHPNYAHSHHNLGGIYASNQNWEQAIAAYQKALLIRPTYYQARLNLGNAYMATGRLDEALEAFREVALYTPSFAGVHVNLGSIYLQQGNPEKAIAAFQQAVRLDPRQARAYNNLAIAYEHLGQNREAIAAYEDLLKHWQGDPAYRESVEKRLENLRQRNP